LRRIEPVLALTASVLCRAAVAAPAQPAAPAEPAPVPLVRVVVLDLQAKGVDELVARNLTDLLATSLARQPNLSVAGTDDLRAMMQAAKEQMLAGCTDEKCAKGLADSVGARMVVQGSVGKIGDTFVLRAAVIDTEAGKVAAQASETAQKPDDLVGRVGRIADGLLVGGLAGRPGATGDTVIQKLKTHDDCVWAAVQYVEDRKDSAKRKIKRPRRLYSASFGSEHFDFDTYDKLEEFLPIKSDLAFPGRFPSCFGRSAPYEDAFSVKEERPLVVKVGRQAADDLRDLRRRRKLVLQVVFEIAGAKLYPMTEYDWRSCDDGATKPFRPTDIVPNAWVKVRSAVLKDMFDGRRYAVTRQQWDPETERATMASLPAPAPEPDEDEEE